jgi:elongator complex protein 3
MISPMENFIRELIASRIGTAADLARQKRQFAKKYGIACPNNIALLKTYRGLIKKRVKPSATLENILRTRPIRSLSGIVNVSVLTKPYPCPGKCLYCPIEKGIPKSYVSGEPAVERAKELKFDPYRQAKKRIETLETEGHPTDKIELRVVGGTWSYYPKKYQEWFIKKCFDACNGRTYSSLSRAHEINEGVKHRIVGLSIETRPDFINPEEIKWLRRLGVTMVELGVQSVNDAVLKRNLRGHGVKEIISATKLLKDAGFKVLYQMMPNLPGSNPKKDLKMFEKLFSDQRFQPDMLKIYPCALIKGAPLYRQWKKGAYRPYTEKQLIDLVRAIKRIVPYYVRIQRITRDIPSPSIVAGPAKISNLRQMVSGQCKCIRCREIKGDYDSEEKLYLFRLDYRASDGKEVFLSFENKSRSRLYSLLRLRLTTDDGVFVREVHTYGQLQALGQDSVLANSPQHKGLGRKLIEKAEKIAKKEFKAKKISVISGIGVRGYYKKLGYNIEDTYMVKKI